MSGDKDDDVFEYGDQTTFRLRDQEFMVDDLNTIAMVPTPELPPVEEAPTAEIPVEAPPAEAKSELARVEDQLDAVLHAIEALQRRVDSIDAMIARVLTR